jgi:hypothetical protein
VKFSPRPRRVSPAMAVSCVSLFVALGGTGYAATDVINSQPVAVASSKVLFSSAQKTKIKSIIKSIASTLTVKSASTAKTATSATTAASATTATTASIAGSAANATNATTAATATTAGTADEANNLGGQPPSFYTHTFSLGGLKAEPYTSTTPATPVVIGNVGPFSIDETCTSTTGPTSNTATLSVTGPSGSIVNRDDSGAEPPTTVPASLAPVTIQTANNDSTALEFNDHPGGATLVTPAGVVYRVESSIAEVNPPSTSGATGCAFDLIAVQG